MGLWSRAFQRVREWIAPPPYERPPPSDRGRDDTPDDHPAGWGEPFGSAHAADSQSNKGDDFSWYVAGYQPRGGKRQDLENAPGRVLSDSELRAADTVVVFISGPIGYRTIGGPWEDWEDLWDDLAAQYDEGDS